MFEPFGNTTVLLPTEWHPEPLVRGTYSILSTCLITMSLCIWTSLHLNLPAHKKEHLQKYRKLGWMVLGLLAPELVVWNAWEQRKRAKNITQLMRRMGLAPWETKLSEHISRWASKAWHSTKVAFLCEAGDLLDSKSNLPTVLYNGHVHAWTDVHSWLVVMGGIAFEDSNPETPRFMPGGRERIAINPGMFEWIVKEQPHLVPDISISEIEDKSKSDWLAKALTCGQASYFCIQCIFRLSQSFSITLLELNVFAHAMCALLLFLIWWDKPRDINKPVSITSEEALDICACVLKKRPNTRLIVCPSPMERGSFNFAQYHEDFEISYPRHINLHRVAIDSVNWEYGAILGNNVYGYVKILDVRWDVHYLIEEYLGASNSGLSGLYTTIDAYDFERLKRISREASRSTHSTLSIPYADVEPRFRDRTSNWSLSVTDTILDVDFNMILENAWLLCGLTFAGACYGGLHITAWSSQFPSFAETLLWRAATITILATGPFCVLLALFGTALNSLPDSFPHRVGFPIVGLCAFVVGFVLLWYVLCRAFIVVECFILMAHIPTSALGVPTWAAYIPHIS